MRRWPTIPSTLPRASRLPARYSGFLHSSASGRARILSSSIEVVSAVSSSNSRPWSPSNVACKWTSCHCRGWERPGVPAARRQRSAAARWSWPDAAASARHSSTDASAAGPAEAAASSMSPRRATRSGGEMALPVSRISLRAPAASHTPSPFAASADRSASLSRRARSLRYPASSRPDTWMGRTSRAVMHASNGSSTAVGASRFRAAASSSALP